MQRIIYEQENGVLAIIVPVESAELALKDVPANTPYVIIDEAELPSDRVYRDGWRIANSAVVEDLEACRAITIKKLNVQQRIAGANSDNQVQEAAVQAPNIDSLKALHVREGLHALHEL